MMTGFFYGQTHSLFPDPSSTRSGVTGKSNIDLHDHYGVLGI